MENHRPIARMVVRLVMVIGSVACVPASVADLEWEQKEVKVEVHPLQTSVTVEFKFENRGTEPVRIMELNPECGCILATTPEKTYAPEETGTLDVTFDFGRRKGEQWKGLEVKTSDPSSNPVKLYIITNIPETYTPSVRALKWATGEGDVTRSCRLVNLHQQAFKLVKAEAPEDKLKMELKAIREGFEYELIVTPSSSTVQMNQVIPIKVYPENPGGLEAVKTYTVYAVIK